MRTAAVVMALLAGLLAQPARAEFHVFACEPEWAALVRAWLPEADITTATHYLQDPHYIEARPSLIAKLRRADLAVCTGASLEAGWLPTLLQRAANPAIQVGRPGLFLAAEQVELRDAHRPVDRSMGDVHPEGNPHVHLAPDRLPRIAEALMERLRQLRPDLSSQLFVRYLRWRGAWNQQREVWRQAAERLRGHSVVVQHGSFRYLLDWLGVEAVLDLEPKPGLPPSAAHLQQLLAAPELGPADAILVASHQDPRPAQWLSEQTGKPVRVLPGTVTDDAATDTLAELISTIVAALLDPSGEGAVDQP
ncbi:metal ABC transporter solute-binding protein, Zn/Mn family [Marinobacter lutaoensis]|nr:zinc ABC transporter substrate-binding protein [Marinobacter lutaoensis]